MPDIFKIRINGVDQATDTVKAAIHTGVQNGMTAAGARGEALVKENIASPYLGRPPAVATGNLLNSVSFQISQSAGISRAVVFSAPPASTYVDAVEGGTNPHFPPPGALLLWVKRKFSATVDSSGKRSGADLTDKQALSIAFAISRTIAKRGTTAFGMFARAMTILVSELTGIFQVAIAEAIDKAGAK